MRKFYKIYHYSRENSLALIDPAFFGTGVCYAALKRGALGINKSYFFISTEGRLPDPKDRPIRYEVYLPQEWKIYDYDRDPEHLLEEAKLRLSQKGEYPYDWLVAERVEKLIVERGYHGRLHAEGTCIALFYALSTKKPVEHSQVYSYSTGDLLEVIQPNRTFFNGSRNRAVLFSSECGDSEREHDYSLTICEDSVCKK